MSVTLSVVITHHPGRPDLPHRLLGMLYDVDEEHRDDLAGRVRITIQNDPAPLEGCNPWRTARAAWALPLEHTHRLVLQDDALPCRNFLPAALRAVEARPADGVAFFTNYLAAQTSFHMVAASRLSASWCELAAESFVPTVALALPAAHAHALGTFDAGEYGGRDVIADDLATRRYVDPAGLAVWCTIPNLVQHDETQPSTILGHNQPDTRQRWATCWIGDHDALAVDWST